MKHGIHGSMPDPYFIASFKSVEILKPVKNQNVNIPSMP